LNGAVCGVLDQRNLLNLQSLPCGSEAALVDCNSEEQPLSTPDKDVSMSRELHINLHQITGGACRKLPGPCPHTVCRFNLTSEHRDNRGAKPAAMHLPIVREACALETAELGGISLAEIGARLSLTPERVRQIEMGALTKLWLRLGGNKDEPPAAARQSTRVAA
jgi:hypothetical protein